MAESMTLEIRGLGLEGLLPPAPGCCSWKIITMPKQGDSAAAAGEAARDKAATGGGMPKSASWSDFAFCFTNSAGNKVEVKTKPAASVTRIEPAASLEGKEASVGSIKPAAEVETKASSAGSNKPAAKVEVKPKREPTVVEVKIEKVDEDYIEYLRKNPLRRPPAHPSARLRELSRVTDANLNKMVDLEEHILEQYDTKGYAMVRVEYLDNGRKRLFRLPEDDSV